MKWDADGRLVSAVEYDSGTLHGRARHEHGNLVVEGTYARGKRHGRWAATDGVGLNRWILDYEHDTLHGECRYWHANGQLAQFGRYHHGERDGEWVSWHQNGIKAREGSFIKGVPFGVHRAWDVNGTLLDEAEFRDGTGSWKEFHDNGSKRLEGQYRDGQRDGRWCQWDAHGRLLGSFMLERGTGTAVEWDDGGTKLEQSEFRDGELHGTQTTWDRAGHLESIEEFDSGKLMTRHEYEEGGRLSHTTEWLDGEIIKSLHYVSGVLDEIWERLPVGSRVLCFEEGEIKEVRITTGNITETVRYGVTCRAAEVPPRTSQVRNQTELHEFGNLSLSLETVAGMVIAVTVRAGHPSGSHRSFRLEAARATYDNENVQEALPYGDAPKSLFAITHVYQRARDGSAFDVRLIDGKVSEVLESRDGEIVRSAFLAEPQYLSLYDLSKLISECIAQGFELEIE